MTIRELCGKIELQPEMAIPTQKFCDEFDFEEIQPVLQQLRNLVQEEEARKKLEKLLTPDEKQIKMLGCMLECALQTWEWYVEKGISETVFVDTMKCFTRFCGECRAITGEYAFDRAFWTPHQIGGVLFRLGELEYEMAKKDGIPIIYVHIPSDADLSVEACEQSRKEAERFWKQYFPEYEEADYFCHSWLLAPELQELLSETSRILKFQQSFEILEVFYDEPDYLEWVFKKRSCLPENLPEDTSLQKKMKQKLMQGGKIGVALGKLKK